MKQEIRTINFDGLLGYGANCYLVSIDRGYILIDSGFSPKRADLEKQLECAGCKPGNLKLIVITHGHGDHIGNCAYLRAKYATPIAMHRGDSEMVERGDIDTQIFNRILLKMIALIAGLGDVERFRPDIYLAEGDGLSEYGFDAKVLHLPGHSPGSIGILTVGGDLFCGDLFVNVSKPDRHSIVTDAAAFNASVKRLKSLNVNTVYPGHGKPFMLERLSQDGQ
jgi:glyoxylase-like metal-dependent hydrolase (beta-lactamase superfamily II)